MTESRGCPCGSNQPYAACCGLYIDGGQRPDTAERLMRSRYKVNGKAGRLHEVSRFTRENGQWSYVDGDSVPPVKKPAR